MAIDIHAHFYPPEFMRFVSRLAGDTGSVADTARFLSNHPRITRDPAFQGELEERLKLMDAAGIETQVLSYASPNIWHPDPAVRWELVRVFNDASTEVVQRYHGRFLLFASVPLPFIDEAIAEATRAFDDLRAVGIAVPTQFAGIPIDDARFEPFYTFLNMRKGIVFFHPDGFRVPGFLNDYGMEWSIGAPFEDTIVLIRLIYSGLLERFPNITWIVPHLGGTLPFLIGRLDTFWRIEPALRERLPQQPGAYLRGSNLYVDTITPQHSALTLAREVFGVERFVLGSDFPFVNRHDLGLGVRMLSEAGLSDQERQGVMRNNIAARLGLADATNNQT